MTSSIVAILGPTASGKTKLSVEFARKWNAHIISLDSVQTYRDGTILSCKALPREQRGIPHHMLGYLSPNEEPECYVEQAVNVIRTVGRRSNVIICGGSISLSLPLLLHPVVRVRNPCVIVLRWDQVLLNQRIQLRSEQMLAAGLMAEMEYLWKLEQQYQPLDCSRGVWKVLGYQSFRRWLVQENRHIGDDVFLESVTELQRQTEAYAARQMSYIHTELLPAFLAARYRVHILDLDADVAAWPVLLEAASGSSIGTLHSYSTTEKAKL